jgi:hypothetical protein
MMKTFKFVAVFAAATLSACAGQPYQAQSQAQSPAQKIPSFAQASIQTRPQSTEDLSAKMARIRAQTAASVDTSRSVQSIFEDAETLAYSVYHYGRQCYVELESNQRQLPGCASYVEVLGEFVGINDVLGPKMTRELARNPKATIATNGDFEQALATMKVVAEAMTRYANRT